MRFDELDLEANLDGLEGIWKFSGRMNPRQEQEYTPSSSKGGIIGYARRRATAKTAAYTLPLLNKLLIEGNDDNVG